VWGSATAAAYAIGQKVEKLVKRTKASVQARLVTLLFGLLPFVMCLVVSSPRPSMAEAPPGGFLLDRALADIAAKRRDLSIRPDLFSVPLVSNLFKQWMENPLKAPLEAQEKAKNFFLTARDPVAWLQELAGSGDPHAFFAVSLKGYKNLDLQEHLPGQLVEAIHLILNAIDKAHKILARVKSQVSPQDIKLFERHLYPGLQSPIDPGGEIPETPSAKKIRQAVEAAANVDWEGILEAGFIVLNGLVKAQTLLTKDDRGYKEVASFSLMTPLGVMRIGGTSNDVHEGNPILVLDLGGNDLYKGKVASGGDGKCGIVLDLDGDDVYLGGDNTQGSGLWGVGVLFDLKGNDLYRADRWSQGAALFGIGLLMDGGGDDNYLGGSFVQAASSWGWGGLIDLEGDDVYKNHHSGQAYSGVRGASALCDLNGNDKYISGGQRSDPREPDMNQSFSQGFAFGRRNLAGGGISILADRSGNDLYQCQYFCQGASYWAGVGILYDEEGKDIYVARRYAQGAGIHFSLGILMDVGGSDHTFSWGVSQGCGHDYGIGILVNESGQDTYVSEWLSMGASEANGVGIFIDNLGNDGYEAKASMGVGSLSRSRRAGGIGLFVDASGKDRYSARGANNAVWIQNRWGVGMDEDENGKSGLNLASPAKPSPDGAAWQEIKKEEQTRLSAILAESGSLPYPLQIDGLLTVASHWGHEKEMPKAARERLLSLEPEKSVPVVLSFIGTPDVSRLIFLRTFFMIHAYRAIPALINKTRASDPLIKSRVCRQLGLLRDTRTRQHLLKALKDPSWRVRSSALWALGQVLDHGRLKALVPMRDVLDQASKSGTPDAIRRYLEDDKKRASLLSVLVRALPMDYHLYKKLKKIPSGKKGEKAIDKYAAFVYDHLGEIRPLLETWIRDINGSDAIASQLMIYLDDPDPEVKRAAAYSLGQINYRPAIPRLLRLIETQRLWGRDSAVLSLALFGDTPIRAITAEMKKKGVSFKIIALDLLGRIGDEEAKTVIKGYLGDPDSRVRRAAKRAMEPLTKIP
jgi:HEAT repeat protein